MLLKFVFEFDSSVCFVSQGMLAYQSFALLWQYSPSMLHHIPTRPFNKYVTCIYFLLCCIQLIISLFFFEVLHHALPLSSLRAILRMLEGLQSQDAAVRHFVSSWVRMATLREEDTAKLLRPLLRILAEAEPLRRCELNKCPFSPYEVRLTKEEAAKDPAYAKYYFASLGISDPEEALKKSQYKESALYYIQVFDVNQVLYSLSLLLSTVSVDPTSIITCMSSIVVDSLSYMNIVPSSQSSSLPVVADSTRSTNKDSSAVFEDSVQLQPGSSQKSVLELVLTTCIRFLQSEFHLSLEVPLEDHLDHVRVKILCTELLEVVHTEFVRILARAHSAANSDSQAAASQPQSESNVLPNRGANITNASYVTALVTLCDIQKTTLLLLAGVVQDLRGLERDKLDKDASSSRTERLRHSDKSASQTRGASLWRLLLSQQQKVGGESPGSRASDPVVSLGSLFVHLLKLVQSLITLDSQCQVCARFSGSKSAAHTPLSLPALSSMTAGIKLSDGNDLPSVISGITTASQPFFQILLLDILGDASLNRLHVLVLAMFTIITPNLLGHQIDELAPKILKQLCKNLEQPRISEKAQDNRGGHQRGGKPSHPRELNYLKQNTVSYLEAAVMIILWCLFGEKNGRFSLQNERGRPSSFSNAGAPHRTINLFWKVTLIAEKEEANLELTPTLKQTSTIAWLLGVFSQKGGVAESSGGGGGGEQDGDSGLSNMLIGASNTGLTSLVGQYIIMLLPAVYQVLTDLWRVSSCGNGAAGSSTVEPVSGGTALATAPPTYTPTEAVVFSLFERVAVRNNKMECRVSTH